MESRGECVIGVDPGGTTGVAVFEYGDDYVRDVARYQLTDSNTAWITLKDIILECQRQGYRVTLVVEQFDKRPGIVNPDYTPKYVIRDIENNVLPTLKDVEYVKQIPALAMNMVKPARKGGVDGLKRFGWYRVSNVHSNDAARHVAAYLIHTLHHMPTILKGWPKPKEPYGDS